MEINPSFNLLMVTEKFLIKLKKMKGVSQLATKATDDCILHTTETKNIPSKTSTRPHLRILKPQGGKPCFLQVDLILQSFY